MTFPWRLPHTTRVRKLSGNKEAFHRTEKPDSSCSARSSTTSTTRGNKLTAYPRNLMHSRRHPTRRSIPFFRPRCRDNTDVSLDLLLLMNGPTPEYGS